MCRTIGFLLVALGLTCGEVGAQIRSGETWYDARGKVLNAHGGNLLFYDGVYYWYGEHKIEGLSEATHADGGVHCYASNDLVTWYDQGMMLPLNRPEDEDLTHECNSDRPKVVYNERTRCFVLFFKLYLRGMGSDVGYVGVATSRSPVGPFRYSHKFLGGNSANGTGDFAMFKDTDGVLYHIAVQKPSKRLVYCPMTDDYLMPAGEYRFCEGVARATEAPAVIRHEGRYYLLGSGSTGWAPNAARSYTSTSLAGPWQDLGNPLKGRNPHNGLGPELSFGGQSHFIFGLPGEAGRYVAMFDINKPEHPYESLYIWLPMRFESGRFEIAWQDEWNIDMFDKK